MGSTRKRKGDSLPNEAAAKAPKGSNGKKKAKRIKQPENQYLSDVLKLKAAWPEDMGHLLARLGIDEARRQELWQQATEEGAAVSEKYAWAIPDTRALNILKHFSPIVEVGAGSGYWAHLLSGMGADCTAYDICEPKDMNGQPIKGWHPVKRGSPGKLKKPKHKKSTLFLCYPDDFEASSESMALQCLEVFQGSTVIHAGELFGDTPMMDSAPWGRTSGSDFQTRLFSEYRCVLKVALPRWPHSGDHLTVWQRCTTCVVHDAEASDSDSDEAAASDEASTSDDDDAAAAAAAAGKVAGSAGGVAAPKKGDDIWDGEGDPYALVGTHSEINIDDDDDDAWGSGSDSGADPDDLAALADLKPSNAAGKPGLPAGLPGLPGGWSARAVPDLDDDDGEWDGGSDPYARAGSIGGDLADAGGSSSSGSGLDSDDGAPRKGALTGALQGQRRGALADDSVGDDEGDCHEGQGGAGEDEWDGESDPYAVAMPPGMDESDDDRRRGDRGREQEEGASSEEDGSEPDCGHEIVCDADQYLCCATLRGDAFAVSSLQHLVQDGGSL